MIGRTPALPLHLTAATLLRVSAEGVATALVLTVQARTGDAATAGFLQTAMLLPYVVSGPVIGHALDRSRRPRRMTLALAAGYAVATAVLLLMAGRAPLVLALAVAAVIGCTEPVVVALTSLLPRFVRPERLSRAYGLEASSYNLAAIAGPGLAAALAGAAGGQYAGAVIVASAALGLAALPLLPFAPPGATPTEPGPPDCANPPVPVSPGSPGPADGPEPAACSGPRRSTGGGGPAARAGPLSVVGGGLVVLAHGRVLRALTVATTFAWLGYGGVAVTAVLFAEHIGAPPSAGGRLIAALAAGSLAGSLAAGRWLRPRHAERVLVAGLVAFGTSLALLAMTSSVPWAMAVCALAGACEGPVFAATLMLRQRESPPDRLGQVNTTGGSLKIGASALGAALTAASAGWIGPVGLILAIAGFQLAGAALGWALLHVRENQSTQDGPAT